ncbi:hypothetical protein IAR55_001304 [Kwoniella newhampshirensis]|uniref:Uncharacterized protein n=1 Tax=Kwoniella newhampshirensis TaxID=1651941 RepID=A0AAW0Z5N5_9TREE
MSMENAYEAHVVDPNVSLSDDFRSSSPAGELMLKLGNGETLNETERSATREAFLYDPSFLTYLETQECTPGDPEIDRIIADYAYWLINLESTLGEHAVHVSDNSDLPYAEESSNDLNSSARHQVDKDEMRRLPDITQETMPPRLPITQNPELYDTRQQNAYQLLEMLFPTDFSVPPQTDIYSPIGLTSKVYLHPQDAGRVSDQVGTTPLFKNPAIPSDHTVSQESPVDLDAYYLDFLNSHVFQPPTSPPEETHSHSHEDAPDLRNEIVVKEPEVSSSDLTPLSGSSTDDETTTDNWKSPSESDDVEGDPSYDTKNKKRKRNQSDVVLKHQRVFGGHKGHSQVSSTRKSRGRKRNESTRRMRQVKEEHVEKRAVKSASEAEQHVSQRPFEECDRSTMVTFDEFEG